MQLEGRRHAIEVGRTSSHWRKPGIACIYSAFVCKFNLMLIYGLSTLLSMTPVSPFAICHLLSTTQLEAVFMVNLPTINNFVVGEPKVQGWHRG